MFIYKSSWHLIKQNYKSLLLFELLYKLLTILLLTPILINGYVLSIRLANVTYLSRSNWKEYIAKPSTLLLLCFVLAIVFLLTLFETTVVIRCFQASHEKRNETVLGILYLGYQDTKKILRRHQIYPIIMVLMLLLLCSVGGILSYGFWRDIAHFTTEQKRIKIFISGAGIMLYLLLLFAVNIWILSVPYVVLGGCTAKEARKKSYHIMKGHLLQGAIGMLGWHAMLWAVVVGIGVVGVECVILFVNGLVHHNGAFGTALAYAIGIRVFLFFVYICIQIPCFFAFIMARFYQRQEAVGEFINNTETMIIGKKRQKSIKRGLLLVLMLTMVCCFGVVFGMSDDITKLIEQLNNPTITAHRGDSVSAPENSMIAFEHAIQHQADYIELDVHQTKDGVVVVTHDACLKRIAGIDKNVWEMSYRELKDLDIGSWFDSKYKDVRMVTLDEVLKHMKGRILLNIELKPTGHEQDFVEHVIKIIEDNQFQNKCFLASLDYEALENVKRCNPSIQTTYIVSFAIWDPKFLDYADNLSMQSSYITKTMVTNLHQQGKEIYAWTVNREKDIQKMIDLGVDSIITDDPVLARELKYSKQLSPAVISLIRAQIIEK